jgi:hypothetical protein
MNACFVLSTSFPCTVIFVNLYHTSQISHVQILEIDVGIKVKVPRNRPEGPEGGGGRSIALLFLDLGARRGWVVSTTPLSLYPREKPGTHCTEGWVGPRAGLDVCEKSRHHRDSIPGPSSRCGYTT